MTLEGDLSVLGLGATLLPAPHGAVVGGPRQLQLGVDHTGAGPPRLAARAGFDTILERRGTALLVWSVHRHVLRTLLEYLGCVSGLVLWNVLPLEGEHIALHEPGGVTFFLVPSRTLLLLLLLLLLRLPLLLLHFTDLCCCCELISFLLIALVVGAAAAAAVFHLLA